MRIEFDGPVTCERAQGAVNLLLRADAVEILFSGADPVDLPATLHNASVTQEPTPAEGAACFRIESAEVRTQLHARCVQVHRNVAAALFEAVPPTRVPLRLRAGWSVLLSVLGVPGVGRLLLQRRGAS